MSRTLRTKQTLKQAHQHLWGEPKQEKSLTSTAMHSEIRLMNEIAKDMLSPREEAIAAILRMSKMN